MPPSYFPLRWESTGDQWWYASPIDWAAANGLYDLVIELLHLDTNLLIKLTSLRRIRRLETVWDDDEVAQFNDVAKCRSLVARRLLQECERGNNNNNNSLIRAGYGGWLLYTAASAGDVGFVKQLLERDPLLVFGEGEYGVTDIFYAAARSKNSDVFRMLLDLAVSSRSTCLSGDQLGETWSVFKWEMMNRAAHAAARGGSLEMLREIVGDCRDVLVYRDEQGSTILHTASGRGQVEVVKDLLASFDIINSIDNQGNTALHVAAYRGYLKVVEFLIRTSPTLVPAKNKHGNTFLHVAVAGYRMLGFRRMDQQIELMKRLVCCEVVDIRDIINVRNQDGRTALHMAVTENNVQSNLVELLMSVPSIDLNALDADGMTPLDLLKIQPKSASSEILTKELIAAGGISNCQDYVARNSILSREQGIGGSPGTSFRIPDAEIFLYTGSDNASYDAGCDQESVEYSSCLSELNNLNISNSSESKKSSSINHTARRLKFFLQWPRKKERKTSGTESVDGDNPMEVMSSCRNWADSHIPLREKYSKSPFLPSKSTRKKFTAELTHGVLIQAAAQSLAAAPFKSPPTSPFSASSSAASPISMDEQKDLRNAQRTRSNSSFNGRKTQRNHKQASFDKSSMMNQYFCFGAQGLAVEDSRRRSIKSVSSLAA